ncbi:MAG TPA: VIT1/CCC1 family protein [Nitrososphaerales archaeon]|nr:VIT1/CCC1 family protein [Nitrososphaerales archaeon]
MMRVQRRISFKLAGTMTLSEVAKEGAADEYTDYIVYKRLAESSRTKDPKLKEILTKLSKVEWKHYEFWIKYSPESKERPKSWAVYVTFFLRFLFGITFAIKFLEKHEDESVKRYKSVLPMIPEEDRKNFDEMIADEVEHESTLMNETKGKYIKYISFVVLGLADAIVEISGIHAGSLGIYNRTELAGLAGIIAGAAASIAMASAAFAQAKQGFEGSATVSAGFTGVSYFVSAIILATPYFLTKSMSIAIGSSITLAIIIIAFISYYNSIISNAKFLRDFSELAGIALGASGALFLFGFVIRSVFGIII